jgi:predicted amidophosphoribosyltransferase
MRDAGPVMTNEDGLYLACLMCQEPRSTIGPVCPTCQQQAKRRRPKPVKTLPWEQAA